MKLIKIGTLDVQLCYDADDLNIVRKAAIDALIAGEQRKSVDLEKWARERKHYYNTADMYSLLVDEQNMLAAMRESAGKRFTDVMQILFAIITLEPGESPDQVDDNALQDKLLRFAEQGLTQLQVREAVEDFILASPQLFQSSFLQSLVALMNKSIPSEASVSSTQAFADIPPSKND